MVSALDFVVVGFAPVAMILVLLWISRWRWRKHVWADIELQMGKVVKKRYKPDKSGWLHTDWGDFVTHPEGARLFRGLPQFRYRQGDPFPVRYDRRKVIIENEEEAKKLRARPIAKGKWLFETTNVERLVIPGPTLAVFMKQKIWADIYSRSYGIILLLLIAIAFVGILVIGLYMRT